MDDLIERLRDAAADAAAEEYGVAGLLAEAAAALEAAREDAERYRWLRETGDNQYRVAISAKAGDVLDAAIDAAIAEGDQECGGREG